MKTIKGVFIHVSLIVFALLGAFTPSLVGAQTSALWDSQTGMAEVSAVYGNQDQSQSLGQIATRIILVALEFLGLIFLALILFAGFKWMTSQGNEKQIDEAKGMLKNAIIGLVIVLAAWLIARFLIVVMNNVMNNRVDVFQGVK